MCYVDSILSTTWYAISVSLALPLGIHGYHGPLPATDMNTMARYLPLIGTVWPPTYYYQGHHGPPPTTSRDTMACYLPLGGTPWPLLTHYQLLVRIPWPTPYRLQGHHGPLWKTIHHRKATVTVLRAKLVLAKAVPHPSLSSRGTVVLFTLARLTSAVPRYGSMALMALLLGEAALIGCISVVLFLAVLFYWPLEDPRVKGSNQYCLG